MAYFDNENTSTLFTVEYSNNYDHEPELHRIFCETRQEANEFEDQVRARYRAVWIGASAEYLTAGGNWREDWVWIWWTEGTNWGDAPDRGYGIPNSLLASREHREYRPKYGQSSL
jgi:hypothetical protein